jgi:hypothetical protein
LLEAIKPQKKNTTTRVDNAPELVVCLVWLIRFVSLIVIGYIDPVKYLKL